MIKEILDKINKQEYKILPPEIAINTVYKIEEFGKLDDNGIEIAYLYIPKNSGIKLHKHTNEIERYKCLKGTLKVKGEIVNTNICLIDETHEIEVVPEDTIIETCKIKKEYLSKLETIDDKTFDKVIKTKKI